MGTFEKLKAMRPRGEQICILFKKRQGCGMFIGGENFAYRGYVDEDFNIGEPRISERAAGGEDPKSLTKRSWT